MMTEYRAIAFFCLILAGITAVGARALGDLVGYVAAVIWLVIAVIAVWDDVRGLWRKVRGGGPCGCGWRGRTGTPGRVRPCPGCGWGWRLSRREEATRVR